MEFGKNLVHLQCLIQLNREKENYGISKFIIMSKIEFLF